MKIGVIGVGNIAEKAYLPTYAKNQGTLTFYFATRNEQTKKRIKEMYGFSHLYETIDELIAEKIEACMIHAATKVHYELAKRCLEQGIHVFIDKPLSTSLHEVAELQALAKKHQVVLMIGFNRRFAPMVEELKQLPNKRLIQLQKNRIAAQETTEFVVYDLFLHLVDTAVYLLDEPITQVNSKIIEKNDYLELAMLHLETANQTAILTMDLRSGANTEQYQVTSEQGTYEVRNLTQMTIQQEGQTRQKEFGDWTNTLEKRGFEPMIMAFFEQIQHTQPNNQQLKQTGVYQSHELCEQMIRTQLRHLL
ncbi:MULTISPECIES: Gfo/Idh/MocA family protein [Enterococcus]|uniref:Dehydrogenase n=1 Tax=Enterococcus thailandicus TaxID=417368 RepID=A0A179EUU5_ENTTH|nr:Gfo/Idh/MocA family oxidoreductase [Enterococcus thailandicus]ASZ06845.1 gfo/Idh/MocA family oxidoreductase [Enterococcus thailandicus]MDA3964287.1 Gfo/Idh/MocA family oxidoreductase [Enterococcus thailandicus]MDK4351552.1 Gfo/Idh/MocA family oxidoreductase [Enterococcus thailandicus]MDT2733696.1 Gfo/Idh/MocA family oxidoreductase [Enterococcus thailandicus]MDT2750966.1 Gfo/Idh/MocA family oxidoreductase [Enterococcus thailandicus]